MKRALMEFLGTFFFILTIAMGSHILAVVSMLMAWIYIGGHISGGHYNPALSLAAAVRGKLEWEELPIYWAAQILGGIAAYGFVVFMHGHLAIPSPELALPHAFLIETLLAFVFASVFLVVATIDKFKEGHIAGFAIAFTIPALAALGKTTGGLFNPAIALGATIMGAFKGTSIAWESLLVYVGGALLGGFIAAYVFDYFYLSHKR